MFRDGASIARTIDNKGFAFADIAFNKRLYCASQNKFFWAIAQMSEVTSPGAPDYFLIGVASPSSETWAATMRQPSPVRIQV
jgi:DNA-binding FadR family transcriptional regulator